MADPSPAARAISTAFKIANCDPYLVDHRKASLAAALQAAADQAADLQVPWSYTGESYQTYDKGLHAAAEHLRAIATELGAMP
jgi:hypothetical protein